MYEKMLLVVLRRGCCIVVDEWNLTAASDDGGMSSQAELTKLDESTDVFLTSGGALMDDEEKVSLRYDSDGEWGIDSTEGDKLSDEGK